MNKYIGEIIKNGRNSHHVNMSKELVGGLKLKKDRNWLFLSIGKVSWLLESLIELSRFKNFH